MLAIAVTQGIVAIAGTQGVYMFVHCSVGVVLFQFVKPWMNKGLM